MNLQTTNVLKTSAEARELAAGFNSAACNLFNLELFAKHGRGYGNAFANLLAGNMPNPEPGHPTVGNCFVPRRLELSCSSSNHSNHVFAGVQK